MVVPGEGQTVHDRERRQHVPGRPASGDDDRAVGRGALRTGHDAMAGDVQQESGGRHAHEQRATARGEKNGRVSPVDGQEADDATHVDRRLHDEPAGDATREQHAEAIPCRERDLDTTEGEDEEATEHGDHPDEPELLPPTTAKMKSLCASGRKSPSLLSPLAGVGPGHAALGNRDPCLPDLVAQVIAVVRDVEERREPVEPTLAREHEAESDGRGDEQRRHGAG